MQFPTSAAGGRFMPIGPLGQQLQALFQVTSTVPQVTSMMDVDMSRTAALRRAVQPAFEKLTGASLGFMPFFIRAATGGLRAAPQCNATLAPGGLWLSGQTHIGFSVNSPAGALVPVIRDADRKNVAQLAVEIYDKTRRARAGVLPTSEYQGATFGVSNPGTLGIVRDAPLVIPPHVAIMTCGAIEERPVAVNGRVEIHPMMTVSLSFDHRALDGDVAATFLKTVKACLEQAAFA